MVGGNKDAAPSLELAERDRLSDELLAIVRNLAVEVHPHLSRTIVVGLDSDLDLDLGLDSLARSELVLRLDRTFKVRLPDRVIADAATPADLLRAVEAARPQSLLETFRPPTAPAAVAAVTEPVQAETLLEAFDYHVRRHGGRPHVILWHGEEPDEIITYAGLDAAARRICASLFAGGHEPGDRVAIMLPTEAGFFQTFLGVLMAGGVPVPVYPPFRRNLIEDHLRRQAGILRNAAAATLVTSAEIRPLARLLYGLAESLKRVETVGDLLLAEPMPSPHPATRETTALIQYTSGSTGDPKGVVLSHGNLLANIRAMGAAIGASSTDIFVSWLPLYHDMGLIGAWLGCLYYGAPTVIMPPLAFLADPARWLKAIHRHRATLSAAPNFAFELCLKSIRDDDIRGLDLSSLRMVVNGAEPVSAVTVARFTDRFRAFGFRAEAMAPVYGLAENAVGLAFPRLGRPPIIDRIDRDALARDGVAKPVQGAAVPFIEFVACGQPVPGHEVRIVDDLGRELPERREGRLEFKGPSATKGYFANEEKTRRLFNGPWLDSGDRAYVAGGDIYITGRVKDMIIRAGRNVYPQELEEAVGALPGVRKGCVAAFASRDERTGTERLVVMAETRLTKEPALDALRRSISETSTALLELPADEILLVPPRTVPKTSSGKIRRSAARELYEQGTLSGKPRPAFLQLARLAASGIRFRSRRVGRAVIELAYAAYWWSMLALIGASTWLLVMLTPRRAWRHALVRHAARLFLRLTAIPLLVDTEAPLPERRAVLVANHSSYLDSPVLAAALPGLLSFVAKSELERQLVAGPFLRRLGTLFARRVEVAGGVEDTRAQVAAAKSGLRIVSFPEGTLTRMPGLLPFHLGAFVVASEAEVPIVPITISGTRSVLRGGQWFPRRGVIRVHIGRPITPIGKGFEAALALRDATRAAMLARINEPDLGHERIVLDAPAPR
jgi:1-acyl-sn-glycerol-3-phosphate acyltransferase